jgi:hypothetical protein
METTMNIQVDVLRVINEQAQASGISRSQLIIFLIKKAMDDISEPRRFGSLVRYQDRGIPGEWHAFHIRLRPDDYEYLLDLRKLCKMSVSLILAYCAGRYLLKKDKTMKKTVLLSGGDKNRYGNYVVIKDVYRGIVLWKLFWGFPPGLEEHLPL